MLPCICFDIDPWCRVTSSSIIPFWCRYFYNWLTTCYTWRPYTRKLACNESDKHKKFSSYRLEFRNTYLPFGWPERMERQEEGRRLLLLVEMVTAASSRSFCSYALTHKKNPFALPRYDSYLWLLFGEEERMEKKKSKRVYIEQTLGLKP